MVCSCTGKLRLTASHTFAVAGVDARVHEVVEATPTPVDRVTREESGRVWAMARGGNDRPDPFGLAPVRRQDDSGRLVDGVLHQAHAVEPLCARATSRFVLAPVGRPVDPPAAVAVGNARLGGGEGHDLIADGGRRRGSGGDRQGGAPGRQTEEQGTGQRRSCHDGRDRCLHRPSPAMTQSAHRPIIGQMRSPWAIGPIWTVDQVKVSGHRREPPVS